MQLSMPGRPWAWDQPCWLSLGKSLHLLSVSSCVCRGSRHGQRVLWDHVRPPIHQKSGCVWGMVSPSA